MESFYNKTVIITGGGRGIGAACAQLFAERGANVVITSRTEKELEATARDINAKASSTRVAFFKADVSQPAEVKKLFQFTKERFGYVSILVNNAGIIEIKPFTETTAEHWRKTLDINVMGSVYAAQEAFAHMIAARQGGCIVNISSLAGIQGLEKFSGLSSYVASKFAVVGLTESLAVEGAQHRIRVNCIAPGAVDTRMLRDALPSLKTSTGPMDIAKTVLWLCDDTQAGKISGSIFEIHSNE